MANQRSDPMQGTLAGTCSIDITIQSIETSSCLLGKWQLSRWIINTWNALADGCECKWTKYGQWI